MFLINGSGSRSKKGGRLSFYGKKKQYRDDAHISGGSGKKASHWNARSRFAAYPKEAGGGCRGNGTSVR